MNYDNELKKKNKYFLLRLDLYFLLWAYLSYIVKQIDSSNYKTAYVNGMQEDLNLYDNELNYFNTTFRVGYGIFIPVSQSVLSSNIIRFSYFLPALELFWGVLTSLIALAKGPTLVYILRFFIGAAEASSYSGIISMIVYWYKPLELAKRLAIFGTSYPLANIFVSSLQIALNEGMDGVQGLSGWRWLFIWNGIITVIIAAAGFLLIPDLLENTHAAWMSKDMLQIAKMRFESDNVRQPEKLTFKKFFAILAKASRSWLTYIFVLAYSFWSWSQDSNTWLSLFLKSVKNEDGSNKFSSNQINSIPIGGYVLQIVFMIIWAYLSDRLQKRCTFIILQQITLLIGAIILSTWPKSLGLKMFAYFILFLSNSAGPLIIAWMSDTIGKENTELRSMMIGMAVCIVNAIDSFQNIFIYPASEAPNYRIGYKAASAYAFASIVCCLIWKFLHNRDPTGFADAVELKRLRKHDSRSSSPSSPSSPTSPSSEKDETTPYRDER